MLSVQLDPTAVLTNLDELAGHSGGRFAGAKRLAWTQEWLDGRAWLRAKLDQIGVISEADAAGNLWASLPGPSDRFVIVGSHIDAVPDGGWLDGSLGALTALETIRQLKRSEEPLPVGVRFVDWADEEGARFGRSLLGSSACTGTLAPEEVGSLVDSDGIPLAKALESCGVDPEAALRPSGALEGAIAYLELHIEQGPVLLEAGRLASAVTGTVGVERHLVTFIGQAAHAGTTPMRLRRDSLAAAARAALEVRESAIEHAGVATVGRMASSPGLMTAVAGRTEMQLDQRHPQTEVLAAMREDALAICETAADAFGCELEVRNVMSVSPTAFDPALVAIAQDAIREAGGGDGDPIPSGALHDATEIGRIVPTVMIFVQSDPPISHASIEDSPEEALRVAIDAYGRTVERVLSRAAG